MTNLITRPSIGGERRAQDASEATLRWAANEFHRAGEPTRILSGSLHYFRIHPDQWRDRLMRAKDLGLNTIDTYIPWNFHQPTVGDAPDFRGWRDVESFLTIAQQTGLDAIVRPGPYICAEWSNGGLPTWLTGRGIPLRSRDERFMAPVREWFATLIPRLAALQANAGGPIVALQVENEFGSFGDDSTYPSTMAELLRENGITEMLFTADGPTELMLDGGSVDGILTGLTLGSRATSARRMLRERRPDEPLLVAEFWNGWFDHWGHPHHVRSAESAAATLAEILDDHGSVSLYMAHGGTNFGLWAGANRVDGELRSTVTSYDSDAPIAEDGTLTPKFHAMRKVLGATAPIVSRPPTMVAPQRLAVTPGASLNDALEMLAAAPRTTPATVTFEELDLDAGMLRLQTTVRLPDADVELVLPDVADHAVVLLDGTRVGHVDASGSVMVRGHGREARLDVVIENAGRVNYGWSLGERKGLIAPVLVERRMIQQWEASHVDIAGLSPAALRRMTAGVGSDAAPSDAGAASAEFTLTAVADAHLALPGFERGFVWVNDFLLGRYRGTGPQETLYIPAPLLRAGRNTVTVLELERRGTVIELRDRSSLGPEEEYIEQF